jgi:hypothetical protein
VPRSDEEMVGLVYSLTPKVQQDDRGPWYTRPGPLAIVVGVGCLILNLVFY